MHTIHHTGADDGISRNVQSSTNAEKSSQQKIPNANALWDDRTNNGCEWRHIGI